MWGWPTTALRYLGVRKMKKQKPIVVAWAILLILALYGVVHYWPPDRLVAGMNLVLAGISSFALLREWLKA